MKRLASRGVCTLGVALLLAGCGSPRPRTILDLCGYLQQQGYRLSGYYDMQSSADTAIVAREMGGRTALVQVDGLEVMVVQKGDARSASRAARRKGLPLPVPGLEGPVRGAANRNLVLYLQRSLDAEPEARRLLRDFSAF